MLRLILYKVNFLGALELDNTLFNKISEYSEDIIQYICGFICKSASSLIVCDKCRSYVVKSIKTDNYAWITRKDYGNYLLYPQLEILSIFKYAETFLRPFLNVKHVLKPGFFDAILNKITQSIISTKPKFLFELKDHSKTIDHRYIILQVLLQKFVALRIKKFIKITNDNNKKKAVRKNMSKEIHFRNQ